MSSPSGAAPAPGIKVATIAGVPVYIGRSWGLLALIIVALIGPQLEPSLGPRAYLVALGYAVLLLLAVMVHEGAHAVGARSFGLPVHRVVADLWGGHTALDVTRSTPGRSAVVAVVGPLANLALSALGYAVAAVLAPGIAHGLAEAFGWLNLILALFNLLPGLPLDGGQLVESLVWRLTGDRHRGRVVAGYCGIAVTLLVVFWFVGRPFLRGDQPNFAAFGWTLLICFFLWQGARSAITAGHLGAVLDRVRVADVLTPVAPVIFDAPLSQLPTGAPPVVIDRDGRPVALLDAGALQSVPPGNAAHTPVSAVSRPQPPQWVLDVDPQAPVTELFAAMNAVGTGILAVCHHGRLLGVVTAETINTRLDGRT